MHGERKYSTDSCSDLTWELLIASVFCFWLDGTSVTERTQCETQIKVQMDQSLTLSLSDCQFLLNCKETVLWNQTFCLAPKCRLQGFQSQEDRYEHETVEVNITGQTCILLTSKNKASNKKSCKRKNCVQNHTTETITDHTLGQIYIVVFIYICYYHIMHKHFSTVSFSNDHHHDQTC